ncbi:MAG: hypothetical protein LPK47_10865, partial [Bacteroidota bacterium]|nr:hypothetical protein [Bacteroidota bacterium]
MKRSLLYLMATILLLPGFTALSQTTLSTTHTANNGSTAITFEVSATSPIIITGIANAYNSGTISAEVWYRVGGVLHSGATTPSVSAANGWVQLVSTTVSGNGTTPVAIPGNYQLNVGVGQTVGICVTGGTRYMTYATGNPVSFTDNTLTITTGPGSGFGGGFPNPTIATRQFVGSVTYQFAGPCTNPPYVGNAVSDKSQTCAGERFTLSLDSLTSGLGQSYQWQSSPDSTTWSNITGATSPTLDTSQTTTTYYRCYVTCTASDTSGVVKVETNTTPLAGGTYTINGGLPTGGSNFASFTDFANLISCSGITGPIVVNVSPSTGPYTEQVTFGSVSGASTTNTITINGNGEVLRFASSNTNERATLKLDGTQHLYINDLQIEATGTSYGWGVWLTNGANQVGLDSCYIKIPTTTTSSLFAGFVTSNNATSPTTADLAAWNYSLTNSIIEGGYYGCVINGPSAPPYSNNNLIENNEVRDFYIYGMYVRGQENSIIRGNDINRAGRSTVSTFYGLFLTGDMDGTEVTGNRVHDNVTQNLSSTSSAYPYYFSSVSGGGNAPLVFSNNLLYNIYNLGTIYGIYLTGVSDSIQFYHNTFNLDNSSPGGSGTIRALYSIVSTGSYDFKNNVWNLTDVGGGTKHILYLNSTSPNFTFDYNQFYIDPGANNVFGYYGGNQADFAAWTSATSFESNGAFGNPLFLGPATGNLSPASNVGNNNGANVLSTVPTDINGVARTTSPDRGAYEYVPLPCLQPATILYSATDTSITLSWVNDPSADSLRIEWGPEGFVQGTGSAVFVNATDTSYTFSPLSSLTCFDFYLQTWCSGSAGVGQAKVTVCTDCSGIVPLPFTENFDGGFWAAGIGGNGDAFDPCWTRIPDAFGTYSWRVNSGTTSSGSTGPSGDNTTGSGNYLYTEASYGTTGDSAIILSPGMDLSSIQRPMIEFYYHMYGTQIDAMHLDIWDGDQWIRDIWVQSGSPQNASNDPFARAEVILQPYQNDTVIFRWRANSLGCCAGDMALDDVSILSAPLCSSPSSLTLNSVTSNSANVGWSAYGTNFNIEYGPCGFQQGSGTGTVVNNVSNPTTISGLSPNTCYDVYVSDPCNNVWIGPLTFQTLCTFQLNGAYTIGGPTGPNNFADVDTVAQLLNGCGISGPVTFTVFPGTYVGDITLMNILGSSPTNTITFQGITAAQDTIKGTGNAPAAIHLMGTRHIRFRKLTIDNSTGDRAIWISDDAQDIVIDSCNVNGDGTAVSSLVAVILASASSTSTSSYGVNGSDITISNSRIVGGYYGLRINGASTANRTRNYELINNQFISQYVYAMYFYYADSIRAHHNVVAGTRSPNGYGMYMGYPNGLDIQQNFFDVGIYGIYAFQVNGAVTPTAPSKIINNMIIGGTYGLYFSTASDIDIFHNSIVGGSRGVY